MDDAYSPIWHFAKQKLLRSLMSYSHKKSGISPEDYRFSMSGGFKESLLTEIILKAGGKPWFRRIAFLQYIWFRGAEKLLNNNLNFFKTKPLAEILLFLDNALACIPLMKNNMIRLVWGLEKMFKSFPA